jgi:hypothetical protein
MRQDATTLRGRSMGTSYGNDGGGSQPLGSFSTYGGRYTLSPSPRRPGLGWWWVAAVALAAVIVLAIIAILSRTDGDGGGGATPTTTVVAATTTTPGAAADPEKGNWGNWPTTAKPAIALGASGEVVRYLQGVLRAKASATEIVVDGDFGPVTDGAVRRFQRFVGLIDDGKVGPQTWAAIDRIATSA